MIILSLDINQIGNATITLTEAQVASVHQQEANPSPPSGTVPTVVVPPQVANKRRIVTPMQWANAAPRILSGHGLDQTAVWLIPFKTGAFKTGRFAGAEWVDQGARRNMVVMRNRDAVAVLSVIGQSMTSPSFAFQDSPPPPRSGKIQLAHNELYTLAIWNADGETGPHQLFMELYLQQ